MNLPLTIPRPGKATRQFVVSEFGPPQTRSGHIIFEDTEMFYFYMIDLRPYFAWMLLSNRFWRDKRHFFDDLQTKGYFEDHNSKGSHSPKIVVGEGTDHAIDIKMVRPWDVIHVPYQITISHSLRDFWQSVLYSHDRVNTSTPFVRKLKMQDLVLSFGLMIFIAASMSHADPWQLQTGFRNAKYLWPSFAGDTISERFIMKNLGQIYSVS